MPKLQPPANGVTVRMYRQGLGDCFLLTFRGGDGKPRYLWIDCGVLLGTPDATAKNGSPFEALDAATGKTLWRTKTRTKLFGVSSDWVLFARNDADTTKKDPTKGVPNRPWTMEDEYCGWKGAAPCEKPEDALVPLPDDNRLVTYRGEPGVVQNVDRHGLASCAIDADAVIDVVPMNGDFVSEGDPLFRVHERGRPLDDERLRHSVAVGDERSVEQDPAYPFRLLADISAKALSPGINDPSTSTEVLNRIEPLLRVLAHRRLAPGVVYDADGTARLRWPTPSWDDYLSLALDETRLFGEGSIQVSRRLWTLLHRLREKVPAYRVPAVEAQLELVRSAARRAFANEPDRLAAIIVDPQGIGSSREAGRPR
jgi:hypothetical protein